MATSKDVFGFDELEKAFKKLEKRFPDEADRLLNTAGKAIVAKVKSMTNVGKKRKLRSGNESQPGELKKSWRVGKERFYNNNGSQTRFVRVMSAAPHAHLVEFGHALWVGGQNKVSSTRMFIPGLGVFSRPSRHHQNSQKVGQVEGKKILEKACKEYESKWGKETDNLFDKLTKEVQL